MAFETWLLFAAISMVPAFSPGPGIVLAISNTMRYGAMAALWSSLGNALGLLAVGIAVALGLGVLLAASAMAFTVTKTVSALYLIWLGVRLFRDSTPIAAIPVPALPRRRLFTQALFVAVTNPTSVATYMAILPPFMTTPDRAFAEGVIMAATLATMSVLSHRSYAFIFDKARRVLIDRHLIQWVRRLLGGMLVAFGASIAALDR